MDRDERHRIFKEELYPYAGLDKLEFEAKLSDFLDKHPDIAKEERINPHLNMNDFRKFRKDARKSYY